MQRQHFVVQEKLAKEMEKDVQANKRKLDKLLKKASKSGYDIFMALLLVVALKWS